MNTSYPKTQAFRRNSIFSSPALCKSLFNRLLHPRILNIKILIEEIALDFDSLNYELYNYEFFHTKLEHMLNHNIKNSSPGPNDIHPYVLQNLTECHHNLILNIFNKTWLSHFFPSDWKHAIIIPTNKAISLLATNPYL